jgi:hypothetical protein
MEELAAAVTAAMFSTPRCWSRACTAAAIGGARKTHKDTDNFLVTVGYERS